VTGRVLTVVKLALFVLALLFVTIGVQWESQQVLPSAVRGLGLAGVLLGVPLLIRASRSATFARTFGRASAFAFRHPSMTAGGLAVVSFAIAVAIAYFVHKPYPHISDGFCYYFQAKIFAGKALFAPAPPLPEFFQFEWIAVHQGRWFSIFPPGWPLLLAAGISLGVPVLVNPVLGALCVLVVFHLAKTLYGSRQGLLSALFCCLSPFFLFMSSEFMSHTAALLFTSLSTLCLVKAAARPSGMGLFAAAGAAAGMAFLIRPLDALAIWAAQTACSLWTHRSRRMLLGTLVSILPLACGVGLYVLYNRILVGAWFSAPLLLVSPRNRLGFGPDIGYPLAFDTPGHSPWRALVNLNHNASVMSQDLFGWPITSLLFVVLIAVWGRKDARHGLSFAVIAAMVAGYALFWYHGEAYGARLYFTLLPHLLMLTVEGIRQTPDILGRLAPRLERLAPVSQLTMAAVALCFAFGWAVYVPKVSLIGPYFNHKGVNDGFARFQRSQPLDHALVLVRAPAPVLYGPALLANAIPVETGNVIYVRDLGDAKTAEIVAAFPGRTVHRYNYEREPNPVRTWLERLVRGAGVER
jgi:hypothetical protein